MEVVDLIKALKIVAIIRGYDPEFTLDIAHALCEGGIRLIEVTLNSADPLRSIKRIAQRLPSVTVGAGTVLSSSDCLKAIDAGAKFIISPITDPEIIETTKGAGVVSIPGAFSPTEIYFAHQSGADIIKLFPSILGPEYIKNILGPFPDLPLMPTGGVNPANLKEYLDAGAIAFGIGGGLLKSNNSGSKHLEDILINARNFMNEIKLNT